MGWWFDDGLMPDGTMPDKAKPGAPESWLPYHHVWQALKAPRVKITAAERRAEAEADEEIMKRLIEVDFES